MPHLLRWLERACLACGIACVVWLGFVSLQAAVYERQQRPAIAAMTDVVSSQATASKDEKLARGALIGKLDIPRLRFSEVLAEGDDDATLRKAVGHLPDTPLPWQQGNSAFAGHRDQHFRPLKDIRFGDEIRLTTSHGVLVYRVREVVIVEPDDVTVLKSKRGRQLTLITCYPFSFVGQAPQRFIVRADAE